MNISVIIADKNMDYLSRISEFLQQYDNLTISICSDGDKFQSIIDAGRYDVALFDPDISEDRIIFGNVKLALCLYSDEARNLGLYTDMTKVMKYQRISHIYKNIVREYADKAGYAADFDKSQNTHIISVFSPIGGSGKTVIALAVASGLVGIGKSALFVSMEQLSSSVEVNAKYENGLISLIEAASEPEDKVDFGSKVIGLAKEGMNGMSYVEGFDRIVDYDAVSSDDIEAVLTRIKRAGLYDYIVVDLESRLGDIEKSVISLSDHIVVVERPGELPSKKMQLFAEQAVTGEYKGKMVRVGNFAENNSSYTVTFDAPIISLVHNYGNLPLRNMIGAIISNGELDVRQIIKAQ